MQAASQPTLVLYDLALGATTISVERDARATSSPVRFAQTLLDALLQPVLPGFLLHLARSRSYVPLALCDLPLWKSTVLKELLFTDFLGRATTACSLCPFIQFCVVRVDKIRFDVTNVRMQTARRINNMLAHKRRRYAFVTLRPTYGIGTEPGKSRSASASTF